MSQSRDQFDCAGSGGAGITDLVFDDQTKRDGLGGFAILDYRALR